MAVAATEVDAAAPRAEQIPVDRGSRELIRLGIKLGGADFPVCERSWMGQCRSGSAGERAKSLESVLRAAREGGAGGMLCQKPIQIEVGQRGVQAVTCPVKFSLR